MGKLHSKKLMEIFEFAFKDSATFKRLDTEQSNPCHIMFNGEEYYIYIKNLSPAYFDNPDVWRAQMTAIDSLNDIKESNATFVLLGFDSDNRVYATWNPNQVKQRIGTAKSPSLYSRLSLQRQVSQTREIRSMTLNNDMQVLVFPFDRVVDVFSSIHQFFPDTSDYVALGSKRRSEANSAYKQLTDMRKLDEFAKYLFSVGIQPSEISQMCKAVKSLVSSSVISLHRKVFLAHDSLNEYTDAAKTFFELPAIKESEWGEVHRRSLLAFIHFLQQKDMPSEEDVFTEMNNEDPEVTDNQKASNEVKDWEAEYEDEFGNLTKLMNPELLKKLRPYLDRDYPSLPPAYNIIEDFYGERYPRMQMKDWGKLIKEIDWSRCDENGVIPVTVKSSKRKSHILRVSFQDGQVFEDNNVSTTYCEVIKKIGPEEVSILNLCHAGVNIVSRELDSKYASYQRDIGDGWFVMTNSPTHVKYRDLQIIKVEYGIDMSVEYIPIDPSAKIPIETHISKTGSRLKIKVHFPDGRVIIPTNVFEALIEVVKYARAEHVQSLNINCCGDNLILKTPSPTYLNACKPVGDGWLCNTHSDTRTKYNQIKFISDKLNLGLDIELIS